MGHMDLPWVWGLRGLKPTEKLVLAYVTSQASKQNEYRCWPSQTTIAAEIGLSPSSTASVRRNLTSLERKGLIRQYGRAIESGRQSSNMIVVKVGAKVLDAGRGSDNPPTHHPGHTTPPPRTENPAVDPHPGHTTPGSRTERTTNRVLNKSISIEEEEIRDERGIEVDPDSGHRFDPETGELADVDPEVQGGEHDEAATDRDRMWNQLIGRRAS